MTPELHPCRPAACAARLALALTLCALLSASLAAQLDADFSAAPTSGANPHSVDFTDLTTGGTPFILVWDFGDGSTSTAPSPTHTYTTPGTYTVSLIVVLGLAIDTETKRDLIVVDPAPLIPDFSATPTTGGNPLTVAFADTSTGATVTAWHWDFGAGSSWSPSTSAEPAPSHTYTAPGSYTVTLTLSVGGQDETVIKTDLIEVLPAPLTPAFTATPTAGINPVTVEFTDTTSGTPPTAWLWDFDDGATSTEQHPSHIYNAPGTYDVSLTAFVEQQPQSITALGLIEVDPADITPDFDVDTLSGAIPLTVAFTDLSTGVPPTSWYWNFGDGEDSDEQHPTHTYDEAGTFDVWLRVQFGEQYETVEFEQLITAVPSVTATEQAKLLEPGGAAGHQFGSPALSGTLALISSPGSDAAGATSGAVWVYDMTTGTPLTLLLPPNPTAGQQFGPADLDGDLALIGAPGDDTVGPDEGAAFLFDAPTGTLLATLLPHGNLEGLGWFGRSVAVDGDLALVGAPWDDEAGFAAGAVYVFDVSDPTAPVLRSKLLGPDDSLGLGQAVDVRGTTAVIGAGFTMSLGPFQGRAYLYDLVDPGQPTLIAKLSPWDFDTHSDNFALDVALSDGVALIGAPADYAGKVFVVESGSGALIHELIPISADNGESFGISVEASGSRALIASRFKYDVAPQAGTAYLFDLSTGEQLARIEASDVAAGDYFGTVALDGDLALVGSRDDDLGESAGAVYVFDAGVGTWTDLAQGLAGAGGVPVLSGAGTLTSTCDLQLQLRDAAPDAPTFLVAGFSEVSVPFKGGVLVPSVDVVLGGLLTDTVGDLLFLDALPAGLPAGTTLVFQHWLVDASGPSGFTASNGLSATTP